MEKLSIMPLYRPQPFSKKEKIYRITCIATNVVYIGQTTDIARRLQEHRSKLRCNRHSNTRMQLDYNTYGEDSFVFEVIAHARIGCISIVERECIYQHRANGIPLYNSILKRQ